MQVIGIVSAKGGVGKTTVVSNLGVALAYHFDKKVLVVDGNITTPNLGLYLDIVRPPVTLHDVLRNQISIEQSIYMHKTGLHVIPGSLAHVGSVDPSDLKEEVAKIAGRYDYVLLDSAPGLSEEVSAVIEASDTLLVVTNPGLPTVTTTYKTIKLAGEKNVPVRGVVLNRAGSKYELGEKEVNIAFGLPIVGVIPEDPSVAKAVSQGLSIVQSAPRSPAGEEFLKLAGSISGEEYLTGLLSKTRKLLQYWRVIFLGRKEKTTWNANNLLSLEREMEPETKGLGTTKPGSKSMTGSLNSRKKVYESALARIKKNYEEGLLHKSLYEELKNRYEGELRNIEK